jgi:tyrosinase
MNSSVEAETKQSRKRSDPDEPAQGQGTHSMAEHFPSRQELLERGVTLSAPSPTMPAGLHPSFEHFPSLEELRREERRLGFGHALDAEVVWTRFERRLNEMDPELRGPTDLSRPVFNKQQIGAILKPWLIQQLRAFARRRVDHRTLSSADRTAFNDALQQAHADGSYQSLADVHADMSHRMHSMMGPIGTQRFLPWHRVYLLKMEDLLRSKKPGLTIPYWNYSEDGARPDWVWQPPGVIRGTPGANGGFLPSPTTVSNLINSTPGYTAFTQGIEFDAHNQVHNWCNGTISNPMTATQDPIFWLLHANVDRMWDLWQANHTDTPSLTGDAVTMDPWRETYLDANDTAALGYSYG